MELERLPSGRHRLPREFIARHQRERMMSALVESMYEDGYEKTTVAAIANRASVSKTDFYKQFESKDDCFVAVYDEAVARLREHVFAAGNDYRDWTERICAAIRGLLEFLSDNPPLATLLLVEGFRSTPDVHHHFQAALGGLTTYLRDGAPLVANDSRPPEAIHEATVGGIASLLTRHIKAGETERLTEFFPEIAEFALTPYVGPLEARRIISAQ
ncbi:MAG: TetR/AcrR family transcriptional regulator [Solirubrobacterales bacterium]